jgi:hypothetical protein
MKKIILKLILIYNLILVFSLFFFGFKNSENLTSSVFVFSLIPVIFYFYESVFKRFPGFLENHKNKISIFLAVYSFIFVNLLFISSIMNIKEFREIFFTVILFPLELHQLNAIFKRIKFKKINKNNKIYSFEENIFDFKTDDVLVLQRYGGIKEIDKRHFFKLLAGAGLGVFVTMLINPQKAGAAFFGSVPGPGIVGVKDSNGDLIDPAIKSPTDGYAIANTDTASAPFYYGFVNKDGAWYMVKEVGDGSFLYAKGASGYDWSNRASESYASFSSTF